MDIVTLTQQFEQLTEYWSPRVVAECNGQLVKVAKVKGEMVAHDHENEDEMFLVVKGRLHLEMADREVVLNPMDVFVVPKGVRHRPHCEEETWIVLFEPRSTAHTGTAQSEHTKTLAEQYGHHAD
ncbi:cupin domain-containing protein [Acanthopleuribacter pedis]|uniref:Cupin domain-containing protein n=1 Tax=Acanthopleuribacter pedis TaxID=442870 RepID=A0A8J7Q9D7_9BACT|nr:cupin domain-containing protein [Acanthopleuribacter pedis]MBO1320310.1 cupin domain-containing protein [Acanthopleuribacter pedis]